ncbi:hypothetical protein L917_21318, partial [Phytophthora nicotianae]
DDHGKKSTKKAKRRKEFDETKALIEQVNDHGVGTFSLTDIGTMFEWHCVKKKFRPLKR